jgi:hypothetical protein
MQMHYILQRVKRVVAMYLGSYDLTVVQTAYQRVLVVVNGRKFLGVVKTR